MKTCVSLIRAITSLKDLNIALEHVTVHTVNRCQLQDLERTQEDKGYKDPYSSY